MRIWPSRKSREIVETRVCLMERPQKEVLSGDSFTFIQDDLDDVIILKLLLEPQV